MQEEARKAEEERVNKEVQERLAKIEAEAEKKAKEEQFEEEVNKRLNAILAEKGLDKQAEPEPKEEIVNVEKVENPLLVVIGFILSALLSTSSFIFKYLFEFGFVISFVGMAASLFTFVCSIVLLSNKKYGKVTKWISAMCLVASIGFMVLCLLAFSIKFPGGRS